MRHDIILLHESEQIQIYRCKCCDHYNINYRNLFLTFTRRELKVFMKTLRSLKGHHYSRIHPEGAKAVIGKKRFIGGIGFTHEETRSIIRDIEQAMLMESVNETLTT